jgi:protein-S-isoprenylcysteine O-methyltransferase Ste14
MTLLILTVSTILLVIGLYSVAGDRWRLPTLSSITALSKLNGHRTTVREQFVYPLARQIEKLVKIGPYRRRTLEAQLRSADIAYSPEYYTAVAVASGVLLLVPALILLPFLPVLSVPIIIIAFLIYLKEYKSADEITRKRKETIEFEVPKLAAAIGESQNYKQDVLPVLQSYSRFCSKKFQHELNILISNMKTGNRTAALLKFESRLNSELVSQLVRGLIGIEHGEDMSAYMQRTLINMKSHELSQLSKAAKKRPSELFGANTILLISILVFYFAVLGIQFVNSFKTMF